MNQEEHKPTDPQASSAPGTPESVPAPAAREGAQDQAKAPKEGKQSKEGKQPKGPKEGKGGAPKGEGKPGKGEKGEKGSKGEKGGKGSPAKEAAKEKPKAPAEPAPPPRMRDRYRTQVLAKLKEEFGITNPMALPRLDKIMVTVGIGKQLEGTKLNPKAKDQVLKDLTVITGQKPVMTLAKKSVANFKLREGFEIGAMVTLRGARMWEFFDRLVSLAIPRIKDFRGLSPKSFDGRGNYSFGVQEQGLFPEVNMAEAEFTHGMNITFVFSNSDDNKSRAALREMGIPFAKPEDLKPRARQN
jgi:large subunit ribosomal protein L5